MTPIAVLHEDAQLLAVAKPPGRIVIPGRTGDERSLREELEAEHGRLWVVHRLDRDTSGVILFARTAEAHRALNLAFDRREVQKGYLALVRGAPAEDEGVVDLPLRAGRKGRTVVATEGGKPSRTRWRVKQRLGAWTLLEVE